MATEDRIRAHFVSDWTDEELLSSYRDRKDEEAFEELFQRYSHELRRFLVRYVRDEMLAEDALQGTFFNVHRKCSQFSDGRTFRPWLYAIATNHAGDLLRRNKRHRALSLSNASLDARGSGIGEPRDFRGCDPAMEVESTERKRKLLNTIEALPHKLRSCLEFIAIGENRYADAAKHLEIPIGTVKSRMHSAMRALRTELTHDQ